MLGDLRVLATDDELLLDTERVALQALFDMIRRFKVGFDVELHKRTLQSGLLSLIGQDAVQFNRAFGRCGLSRDMFRLSCAIEENGLLAIGAGSEMVSCSSC